MMDYLKRLASYYLEVLKNVRAVSNLFLINIDEGRSHQYVDLSLIHDCELVLRETGAVSIRPPVQSSSLPMHPPLSSPYDMMAEPSDSAPEQDLPKIAFRRLRDLYQKHVLNPYEREFLYGYPFLVGQTANGRRVCAPLFTVPCSLEYDLSTGEIRLRLISDELQFNSYVWAQVIGEKDLDFLEKTLLATGYPSLPLTEPEFEGFLKQLGRAIPTVKIPPAWEWTLDRLAAPPVAASAQATLKAVPCAAILLVSRPQYYLRRDLAALQESCDNTEESVISRVFDENLQAPPEDSQQDDLELQAERYLFPFESNPRQRQVAEAIEHNRLVFVEGPPGTGKSQTICNVVSHLVASGKTVLVTSQKNKALEVVSDKLGQLKLDYLSVTLLRDDTESKRMLANSLDNLDAHLQEFSTVRLRRILDQLEEKRLALGKEIECLRGTFAEVRVRESQQEERYRRYHETRLNDILPRHVRLPELDKNELAGLMEKYVVAYSAGVAGFNPASWYSVFSAWSQRQPEIVSQPRTLPERLIQIVEKLRQRNRLLSEPSVRAFESRLLADPLFLPGSCPELLIAVECAEICVIERKRQQELVRRKYHDSDQIVELACRLAPLPGPVNARVREALRTIDRCMSDLQGCHRPRWFQLFKVLRRRRILSRSRNALSAMPPHLGPERLGRLLAEWDVVGWKQEEERIRTAFELALLESQCAVALAGLKYPVVAEEHYNTKSLTEVQSYFGSSKSALRAIDLAEQIKHIVGQVPVIQASWVLPHLSREANPDVAEEQMRSFETWARSLPYFATMKRLESEDRFGVDLASWLREYTHSEPPDTEDSRHDIFELAIEAYHLRIGVEADGREFQEDTASLAVKMKECRKALADVIRRLLSARVNERLKQQCGPLSVQRELETLRKALRRGKKNFQSFEKLKNAIDFNAVLKAFPCWIMSIEDVCRVFPLKAGLFDVLIVDESSQCHLMGALPLLYRARSAVVVGDEKQLGNADVMFLPEAVNEELKRRFAIDALPRSSTLDARTESLLTLAKMWKDRKIFLNEHFRSLPEIIKFCNERFYSNKLRVMTHGAKPPPDGVLVMKSVPHALEDDDKINRLEAESLVQDLIRLMEDPRYRGLSFGVLSLFREQAAHIQNLLNSMLEEHPALLKRQSPEPLIVSTVDGFQGDERDVILYSFRYAPNSSPNIFTIQRDERRINVAFSRPRKKVICYISNSLDRFPSGLVRDYLGYVRDPAVGTSPRSKPFDSPFEQDVCKRLQARNLRVDPQYPACGFSIDLVVTDESGRRMAVECDGQFHYDDAGELRVEDLQRQEILERAGWYVVRVPSRRYWRSPDACIDEVVAELGKLPAPTYEEVQAEERPAPPQELPFAPEEEDREIEEQAIEETHTQEVRQDESRTPLRSRKPTPAASGEVQGLPNDPAIWFSLARWAKQKGHLSPRERHFSYTVGRYLSNGWPLSEKMRAWGATIWANATKLGFSPPEGGQAVLF